MRASGNPRRSHRRSRVTDRHGSPNTNTSSATKNGTVLTPSTPFAFPHVISYTFASFQAALINYRFLAHAVVTTDEVVAALAG
jgi:hypothetical protein